MSLVTAALGAQTGALQAKVAATHSRNQTVDAEKSSVLTLLGDRAVRARSSPANRRRRLAAISIFRPNSPSSWMVLKDQTRKPEIGTSLPDRLRSSHRPGMTRVLRRNRRRDQLDRVVAGPFRRTRNGGDFAALAVDQHRSRHPQRPAYALKVLKNLGFWVGKIVRAGSDWRLSGTSSAFRSRGCRC